MINLNTKNCDEIEKLKKLKTILVKTDTSNDVKIYK